MRFVGTLGVLLVLAACCFTGTAAADVSYDDPAVYGDESQQLVVFQGNGENQSDEQTTESGDGDVNSSGEQGGVQFNDSANREAHDEAHEEYASAVDDAEALTAALTNATEADDPASALDAATVAAVGDRVAAVDDNSTRIERLYVQAAANGSDSDRAAEEYFKQRENRTAVTADLESAADDYVTAVESQASDARRYLTALLLGPFVVGAVVGALGGRAISRRDLKRVRRERRRDRTIEYGLGHLWKVLAGATVAVLVGLAVIVVGIGPGDLLTVIA